MAGLYYHLERYEIAASTMEDTIARMVQDLQKYANSDKARPDIIELRKKLINELTTSVNTYDESFNGLASLLNEIKQKNIQAAFWQERCKVLEQLLKDRGGDPSLADYIRKEDFRYL